MPIVEMQHVRKAYDTKIAVADLSFTIEPGSMFGLLGPNGSGKTSSIRMMIGITVPDSGTVNLFGQPFQRDILKRVGYLPEERGLYKKMKVMDQLIFLGELHGLDATTASKRAHVWCERMEITEAIHKKTEELSKGMQQKIQFIAALLMDTLVDLRKQGKTILFSTHRMDQVEKICDAIALISRGHLVLSGGMREVKSRYPRNRIQISFEGDDSFLHHPSVETAKNYGGQADIKLHGLNGAGPDAQPLLAAAIQRGTRITRFEVMEPTLEEIFIETVGENVDA